MTCARRPSTSWGSSARSRSGQRRPGIAVTAARCPRRCSLPDGLPPLPAAIEVAAYRIATEALTNTLRHSHASHATVRLACDDALLVEVVDDGAPDGDWTAGVGIRSMLERAAELGGRCEAEPSASGGRVRVTLPPETA